MYSYFSSGKHLKLGTFLISEEPSPLPVRQCWRFLFLKASFVSWILGGERASCHRQVLMVCEKWTHFSKTKTSFQGGQIYFHLFLNYSNVFLYPANKLFTWRPNLSVNKSFFPPWSNRSPFMQILFAFQSGTYFTSSDTYSFMHTTIFVQLLWSPHWSPLLTCSCSGINSTILRWVSGKI